MTTVSSSLFRIDRTGIWTRAKKKTYVSRKKHAAEISKPMPRTYALKRLLEHGPMTPVEITACTRWTSKQVHQALDGLLAADLIRSAGDAYEAVTHGKNLPDLHPLATKGQQRDGGAPAGALRPGADLEVSAAAALMHEAQACGAGCGCGSGGVGEQKVKP